MKVNEWPWPLIFIMLHVLIWLTASTNFDIIDKNITFIFFPYKSIRKQIWLCRKIGQGRTSVIIWINLVVIDKPILRTKLQGNLPFGRFFMVLTIYVYGGQAVSKETSLKMLNLSELRPRSMNDLDLWYSYRFTYSFRLLRLPTSTTIVSEKN